MSKNQSNEMIDNTAGKIALTMYRIAQGIEKMAREEGEKEGLTSAQVQTLMFLSNAHPSSCRIGSIADRFMIANPTATRIIDSLEKKNLVERVRSEEDRRSVIVEVTEKGREIVSRITDVRYHLLELIRELPEDDKDILLKDMKKIMKSMQRMGYISFSAVCRECVYFKSQVDPDNEKPHLCLLTGEHLSEGESYMEWVHPEAKIDF